jgi:hypothetical protein
LIHLLLLSVPDYSNYVTFELFDRQPSTPFPFSFEPIPEGRFSVRIRYNDLPLMTPACGLVGELNEVNVDLIGVCDFIQFQQYINEMTLSDWSQQCRPETEDGQGVVDIEVGNGF